VHECKEQKGVRLGDGAAVRKCDGGEVHCLIFAELSSEHCHIVVHKPVEVFWCLGVSSPWRSA
jgi:hypothetical protein